MNRILLILLLLSPFLPVRDLFSAGKETLLYVQLRQSKLRSAPAFWSQTLADLPYGAVLVAVGASPTDKVWFKAKSGAVEGYIHVSAVTRRKIILSGAAAPSGKGIDQTSIVLAGKGFNSQVENKYKSAKGLDFAAVDEVERLAVEGLEEAAFIKEGKLIG